MQGNYTFVELTDMHLVYEKAQRNILKAKRMYREKFPNKQQSNHKIFVLSSKCSQNISLVVK